MKKKLVLMCGGFGEKNFGGNYRQGNKVYNSNGMAACILASPVGNLGGFSSLYLVKDTRK